MTKAFGLPMTLLVRDDSGQSDSWNQPYMETTSVPVRGYFWQSETTDLDQGSEATGETLKAGFLPPKGNALQPKSFHALRFDLNGETITWEIVGEPEPKFSLARGGKLHHYEVQIERAA